jgi:hypothetical protein
LLFSRFLTNLWNRRGPLAACALLTAAVCGAGSFASAQQPSASLSAPQLITQPVNDLERTVLKGNTHPLARAAFDRGAAPSSLSMQRMILVLQPSAIQQSSLHALLDAQQTRGSATYHQWLTPQQFGQRFGPADSDLEAVKAWLESSGFKINSVSKGRTAIEFSGNAGQVQDAFHTAMHSYQVDGKQYWANATDPSIPSALAPVVKGVLSLYNFPRHMQSTIKGSATRAGDSGLPLYTYSQGTSTYYDLGPTDFATIYNVLPLWNAGIDGTGQTIAIVGETDINLTDIETFRSLFGLPANDPNIILNGTDPGMTGDEPEADLDVSWSGAVAKNATIDLVVSATTASSLGVDLSALYIVDNNLAPIMSESYGECEATLGNAGNQFYNSLWQQASAQGITVVIAAGDSGSAGCDDFNTALFASDGLAVSGYASTPYNVAVGGTDFDQTATTVTNYWSATNNATTGASALGYIPETTWNQSCAGQGAASCLSTSDYLNIVAGSGGPSNCSSVDANGNCLAGYAKPSWQTGAGVPQDGVRDMPDVSLFASAGFNGSAYIICEGDMTFFGIKQGYYNPCSLANQSFWGIGGTSAAAPTFAGIMALVDQKTASRQGNANYVLYSLAAQSGASCNSSTAETGAASSKNSCAFYDITNGNNSVPCAANSPNCGTAPADTFGILTDPANPSNPAWITTPGYDLATGLGSINAANLVTAWSAATFNPTVTTLTNLSPANLVHGQSVNVSVTVAPQSGAGTPTGQVALMAAPAGNSTGITDLPLVNGTATGTTALLPGGTYNVTAHYPGDGNFAASDSAPVQVTVSKENSLTTLSLESYNTTTQTFSPASSIVYGSIFYLRGQVTDASGTSCGTSPQQSQISCPTGSIGFTQGGKPLDAGTYPLNTLGYVEDQTFYGELTAVGSYAIQGQYSGDASFNPGNPATMNLLVTPAPTEMDLLESQDLAQQYSPNGLIYLADSDQTFTMETAVTAYSVLPPPTGNIVFQENGATAQGTIAYTPFSGNPYPWAYLNGQLTTTISTPGTYIFTASYPGDGNYMAAQTAYSVSVVVSDTTFNITPPIPNVTIAAPGQTGTTTVTLAAVDDFGGGVNVTCTLPAAMTESTCPAVTTGLGNNTTATAQLTITTTGPHSLAANQPGGKRIYGAGALAFALLLFLPIVRKKRIFVALLVLVSISGFAGCGGSLGSGGSPPQDPGTPAGTYTVTVTASSMNITRSGTFTVTVQQAAANPASQ